MSLRKIFFTLSLMLLLVASPLRAMSADFDWLKELNITAVNDLSGFKARLAARFQIGEAQVSTVISNVAQPADAYMVLRLGEMSGRPTDDVIKTYQSSKDKGWGVLAKSMGINPGSKEFHALKRNGDLYSAETKNGKNSEKGKSQGKENNKNKANGKNSDKDKN